MNNLIESIEYWGYKINIYPDENDFGDNPNDWGGSEYFLVYDHRQFDVRKDGFAPRDIFENGKAIYNGYHVFVCYAYIHSGVSLSLGRSGWPFNCPWDTSSTGYVLVKRQKGTWTREKAREEALHVVEDWNMYLEGGYGYLIEDESGDESGGVWGYYGDYKKSGLLESAKEEIDCMIEKEQQICIDNLSEV